MFATLMVLAASGCGTETAERSADAATPESTDVRPGVEVLLSDSLHLVRGRRVGLITNHTGIARDRTSTIDLLAEHPEIELVALFAPEHGLRGEEDEGAVIDSGIDERTGIPIHSLYGEFRAPTAAMLDEVDVLLFDMQDVGARYYTYVSTMALSMEAAGAHGVPFVVLDRPVPIRGDVVQGNVLDPEYSTFVGMYPVPMRHGMTPGELARMYVGDFGIEADLTVVPVEGWTRDMSFDETGLPWVAPSPNLPSLESALAYPGTCLFEGTPLSVGRGTDRAFEWVGAPWLDGEALAAALAGYEFQGVTFEPTTFTPTSPSDGKFDGEALAGVRVVAETDTYDAPRVAVAMLIEARRLSGDEWSWRDSHIDRLSGTDAVRLGIDAGRTMEQITSDWDAGVTAFEAARAPYLIYR